MKRYTLTISLAVAALFAIPTTIFAKDQPAGDHPKRTKGAGHREGGHRMDPEARLKIMTEKLGLDVDQQAKIKAIFEKNRPQFKELISKGRGNLTDADKAALRELKKTQAQEMKVVLTPAQLVKLQELRSQRRRGAGSKSEVE
ncbi:MAG: hypothetical protein ABI600_19140 [Luteolibacter sp.]